MNNTGHVVLVVDDDEAIRETLREVIEDEGYEVVCAENGKLALEALKRVDVPCMILLDLMMPVMDGWTFREQQLSDPRLADIPIVVITASEESNGLFTNVPVLRKPLKYPDILRAVQERC